MLSYAIGLAATEIYSLEDHLVERFPRVIVVWVCLLVGAATFCGVSNLRLYAGALASGCEGQGTSEVKFDCSYAVTRVGDDREPKLALVHATIKFAPHDESHMRVDLTFRNVGQTTLAETRVVYIEFDDDAGRNYIRRPLPHIDLQKVAPGQTKTFGDVLLVPALRPRHYLIRLWIPSADPTLKFDSSSNFLLGNTRMPEEKTALNRIGAITIKP